MQPSRWYVPLLAAWLTMRASAAPAQESFGYVTVSPHADSVLLARADTAALRALHTVLRERARWGSPDPDVAVLAPFFADDVVLLGRFGEIARGREAVLAWFRRMLGFGEINNMRLTLSASGGIVHVAGRYRHLVRRADGRGRFYEDLGTYAWLWERQRDGAWRVQTLLMVPEPNPGSPANPYQ